MPDFQMRGKPGEKGRARHILFNVYIHRPTPCGERGSAWRLALGIKRARLIVESGVILQDCHEDFPISTSFLVARSWFSGSFVTETIAT